MRVRRSSGRGLALAVVAGLLAFAVVPAATLGALHRNGAARPAFTVARAERAVVAAVRAWDQLTHRHTPAFRVRCVISPRSPNGASCSTITVGTHVNLFGDVGARELSNGTIAVGSDDDVLDCIYHVNGRATCQR
jgi:hypothetical protein